ncbi:hypothetical protein B0H14DRAFT_3129579 [Mycena olivaceomarginata]|nr:hypothetical protein B0H14DRAFT_3129579 [Mycena olivaceomarginata]
MASQEMSNKVDGDLQVLLPVQASNDEQDVGCASDDVREGEMWSLWMTFLGGKPRSSPKRPLPGEKKSQYKHLRTLWTQHLKRNHDGGKCCPEGPLSERHRVNSPIPKKLANEAIPGQALKLESSTSAEDQVPKVGRPRRGINAARTGLPRDVETRRNAIPKLIIIKSVMELDAVLQLDWHVENPVSEPADPQNTSASGIPGVKRRGRRDDHIEYLKKAIQSRFDILQNARGSSIASDGMQEPGIRPFNILGGN